MQEATIRSPGRGEIQRVLDFYKKHPSDYLVPRPRKELRGALSSGRVFTVERDQQILAATAVYSYGTLTAAVELSDTCVSEPIQGYGLQSFFFKLRVMHVIVAEGCSTTITTAIDPGNLRSRENAASQGFLPWTPPADVQQGCAQCPRRTAARSCCCDYFYLPQEHQRAAVSKLLAHIEDSKIVLERAGKTLQLTPKCKILCAQSYLETARDFANGQSW